MSYGVKTSIGVNLGFLFLFAMAVTAFCALTLVKQVMVKKEVERAYHLTQTLGELSFDEKGTRSMEGIRFAISHAMEGSAVSLVKLWVPSEDLSYGFGTDLRLAELNGALKEAVSREEVVVQKHGTTPVLGFGGSVAVAAPLTRGKKGGVGVLVSIDEVGASLASSVKILGAYILINLFLLTFAGVHQVSKVAVRPVNRLLLKAENVEHEDDFWFPEEAGSDFSRLSMALNAMIQKIQGDKEKLQASVKELEETNAHLQRAQKDVVRAEKLSAMGRLASGVAHEIGNPLGIITGYLSLIRSAETPLEREDFLARTEEEISRIDGIIRQLLDFNRAGKDGEKRAVSVHALIEDVKALAQVQPLFKGIRFTTALHAEEDRVLSFEGELRQVFMNMVLNAADAIEAGDGSRGEIFIETQSREKGRMAVVVGDNGEGISEECIGNVFDPFFTTKDPGDGTGLGLSVSFMIVKEAGGSLCAKSVPGKGTQMVMEFPVLEADGSKGEIS